MRDMYKIFAELEKRKVVFCFQCQGKNEYYNLSVDDPKGKNHAFSSDSVPHIEEWLKVMWGHLLSDGGFKEKGTVTVVPFPIPRPF